MKNLMYVGGDDIRELTPTDLEKLGVEDVEATLSFKKGRSMTVEDSIAEALLGKIQHLREATPEEMDAEIQDIENQLGFAPYNPNDHTVTEVAAVLAGSGEERRQYILNQEHAGQNRKGVFQAVGAIWQPKEESEAEMADHEEAVGADVVDLTEEVNEDEPEDEEPSPRI